VETPGGHGGNRTPDALLRTEALYPLSYVAGRVILAEFGLLGLPNARGLPGLAPSV
jgi:hypothetical protein